MLVGLSMAIAIGICIIGFIWIYVRVGPIFSDFIPSKSNAVTPVTSVFGRAATPGSGTPNAGVAVTTPSPSRLATASASPTAIWEATHKIVAGERVNFRAGPSTTSDIVDVLQPGTELKFIGQQQQTSGVTWMRFQLKDGSNGWVRNVDVDPIVP